MPAPVGNQFALDNQGGRPAYTDEQFEQLAQEFIAWAKLPTSIRLADFALSKEKDPSWYAYISSRSEVFTKAYKFAKATIAGRREQLVNEGLIKECVYNKTVRMYDTQYADSELERLDQEGQIKLKHDLLKIEAQVAADIKRIEAQQKLATAEHPTMITYLLRGGLPHESSRVSD